MPVIHRLAVLLGAGSLAFATLPPALAQTAPTQGAAVRPVVAAAGGELTPQVLYQFLLAEIAGARGQFDVAVPAYLDLARRTQDARIARRATEVAIYARQMPAATEAAQLWARLDPDSPDAKRILAGVMSRGGVSVDAIQVHLAKVLAESGDSLDRNLLGLNAALAQMQDKKAVRAIIERVTEPYLEHPEADFARAHAAFNAGDTLSAMTRIDQALALRSDWEPAVLMKAQLLQRDDPDASLALLDDYIKSHPDARQALLARARVLAAAKRYPEAREAFRQLLAASPEDGEMVNAVGLLSMQIEDWDEAERQFDKLLELRPDDADRVRFHLAQIAEARGKRDLAIERFREVGEGEQYMQARVRLAHLLAEKGEVEAARQALHEISGDADVQHRVRLAEAQVLRDAGRDQEAFDLLDEGLLERPDDGDLLYESALLAERMGRHEVMEGRLRKLIALEEDNAHALNALGYSLADRGERLEEAQSLIDRAAALSPDDPFIMDSQGWVRFRRGDVKGGLETLERAYKIRPDPEIAAHIGEVLWALDRREEANRVWREAQAKFPDNSALREVIERFAK